MFSGDGCHAIGKLACACHFAEISGPGKLLPVFQLFGGPRALITEFEGCLLVFQYFQVLGISLSCLGIRIDEAAGEVVHVFEHLFLAHEFESNRLGGHLGRCLISGDQRFVD